MLWHSCELQTHHHNFPPEKASWDLTHPQVVEAKAKKSSDSNFVWSFQIWAGLDAELMKAADTVTRHHRFPGLWDSLYSSTAQGQFFPGVSKRVLRL